MSTPALIAKEIEATKKALATLEAMQTAIQKSCKHEFGTVQYVPIITPSHTIPGDPVGTMGIDRRESTYVAREEKKQWQRTCAKCLLVQTTTRTKPQVRQGSIPGTTTEEQVPCFAE